MERIVCALLVISGTVAYAGTSERLEACNDTYADCREDCTIDYGSKVALREKLARCLNKCTSTRDGCRGHIMELEQANIDIDTFESKKKASPPPPEEKKFVVDDPPPPSKREEPVAVKHEETVKEAPVREEKIEEAPIREEKPARVVETRDEEPPPPAKKEEVAVKKEEPPKPPPTQQVKAQPEPEKKKKKEKDISEWDDGDIEH